jgi:uncharacterized membrane protein YgaE (UPF0421/DUF939 family)
MNRTDLDIVFFGMIMGVVTLFGAIGEHFHGLGGMLVGAGVGLVLGTITTTMLTNSYTEKWRL